MQDQKNYKFLVLASEPEAKMIEELLSKNNIKSYHWRPSKLSAGLRMLASSPFSVSVLVPEKDLEKAKQIVDVEDYSSDKAKRSGLKKLIFIILFPIFIILLLYLLLLIVSYL